MKKFQIFLLSIILRPGRAKNRKYPFTLIIFCFGEHLYYYQNCLVVANAV